LSDEGSGARRQVLSMLRRAANPRHQLSIWMRRGRALSSGGTVIWSTPSCIFAPELLEV
jgi:hypothetical protein